MQKTLFTALITALIAATLAAACLYLAQKGYPFAAAGLRRLDGIGGASTFPPLAALYFAAAALMMLLPLRAAAFVLNHAGDMLFWTIVALVGAIFGVLAARMAFGQTAALSAFLDLRYLSVAAVVGAHFALDSVRRNILLRTVFFVVFLAACAAALVWSFRL